MSLRQQHYEICHTKVRMHSTSTCTPNDQTSQWRTMSDSVIHGHTATRRVQHLLQDFVGLPASSSTMQRTPAPANTNWGWVRSSLLRVIWEG